MSVIVIIATINYIVVYYTYFSINAPFLMNNKNVNDMIQIIAAVERLYIPALLEKNKGNSMYIY